MSATARLLIEDVANMKFVSPASYWELAIKVGLGKYALTESYDDFIQHAISTTASSSCRSNRGIQPCWCLCRYTIETLSTGF